MVCACSVSARLGETSRQGNDLVLFREEKNHSYGFASPRFLAREQCSAQTVASGFMAFLFVRFVLEQSPSC